MSSILSNISDTLFHPGGSSDKGVAGIDFSSSSVKIVQIRNKENTPVLQTYGELSYGPYADKSVGETTDTDTDLLSDALQDVIKEAKVTTDAVGAAIPLSKSLVKIIDLPPITDDSKLEEVVPMEARKYIPADPDEVLLDWTLVGDGSDEEQSPRALMVAIHKDALSEYRNALSAAELDVSFFEIEAFSTIRATLDRGIDPIALVDVGASATKVYLVEHGVVHGSHNISQGGEDITRNLANSLSIDFTAAEKLKRQYGLKGEGDDAQAVRASADDVLEHVFARVDEVVSDYQEENATVVEKVVLTGGGAVLGGITNAAQQRIDLDVELADPFAKLQTPDFLEETLRDIGPEFAVAIGVALRRLQEQ